MNKELYIYNGRMVDGNHYLAVMNLLRVLYRLEIADHDAVLAIAMEFRPFYV
mgnify:CR=1 FL=1